MSQRLCALLLVALLAFAPAGAAADPVDDFIRSEMVRTKVPGMAIAVVRDGRIVRAQGFGSANIEHGVAVHPDTLFKTGAVGMPLTAMAVMLLVEDGKVKLDESVRKYLPEAPRSWEPITVRQLLNHTSGLPATPNGDFRVDYSDDELLGIIYKQDLNFPAGSRWRFSYVDYVVLGFLIRRVSGEYYADLLTRRVFAPLGMRTARPIDERAVMPNRAAGYEMSAGEPLNAEWISSTANSTADGSLYLSALDYAAWAAGVADGRILRPESWAETGQPAHIAGGASYPYGLGWFLGQGAERPTWWHSGTWQGFEAFIVRYLGEEITVAVVANGDAADPGRIARRLAALIEPALSDTPSAPLPDAEPDITDRVERLLLSIAEGNAAYRDFADFAQLDFAEMMAEHRRTMSSLGAMREVALFARQEIGNDRHYRYRVRYDDGLVEVRIGYSPNGKIVSLEIRPIEDWDEPNF